MVLKEQRSNPQLVKEISHIAIEYTCYAGPHKETIMRVCRPVRWSKPVSGWVKLTTDGSSLGNPGLAGGRALIRDKAGNWVMGFARKIGKTTSFIVELWALHDGLILCHNRNFATVEVEIDAKAIVDAISNPNYYNVFVSPLMDDCRLLVSRIP